MKVVAVALAGLALAIPSPAVATTPTTTPTQGQISGQIHTLRDQVEEASTEEAKLLDQVDAATAKRRDVDAKIAALDAQIAPVTASLDTANTRLDDLDARRVASELELQQTQAQLFDARDHLSRQAVAAYTSGPAVGRYASLVLRLRDFRDIVTTTIYARTALRQQTDAVHRYQALSREVAERKDQLDQARRAVLDQRKQVELQKAKLDDERNAQDQLRQQAAAAVADQQRLLTEVLSRKQEFETQIAALQKQSDDIAATLRARQSGQVATGPHKGTLSYPIAGAPITSGFGSRTHPIYGDVRMHTGVDFGAPSGTPIHAAADGTIVSAGPQGGYGNATLIDHGNALATLYGHQSSMAVKPGQRVSRGQVIGYVGCTGLCTGPHLHFEVRVNGTPVDPMGYL